MTNYPGSSVTTLSRDISDHMSCLVSITTDVPKAKVFRFENYWLLHDDFMQVMNLGWNIRVVQNAKANKLMKNSRT
jgi:hypothetical protein